MEAQKPYGRVFDSPEILRKPLMISRLRFKKPPQKPRKPVRCKGRIPGTNIKCFAELCETDGEFLYVTSGAREIAAAPKNSSNRLLICERCGFETKWH